MSRFGLLGKVGTVAAALLLSGSVYAADTVKVGLILPMTGPFASTGRQVETAAKAYMATHGDEVAGKQIELIVKDDGGVPDQTKRLAQELVVNDGVNVLAGFGLTPLAFATAPIASQAKVPMVVMSAGTSSITLVVDDIEAARRSLAAAGHESEWSFDGPITSGTVVRDPDGNRIVFAHSADPASNPSAAGWTQQGRTE